MSLLRVLASVVFVLPLAAARAGSPPAGGEAPRAIALSRGDYGARFYAVPPGHPVHGLIVFGSGDGGWSYWEERVCRHLAAEGFATVGVDFAVYAASGYTAETLRRDYLRLVDELRRLAGGPPSPPVFYGGWSMGAEQALPAASDPALRPPGLGGFLLVAPGARGRYGLHLRDRLGVTPKGPDTFSLHDLAAQVSDLRFAVFHGGLDILDDLNWSKGLTLDYKRWVVPHTMHDFSGASDAFLTEVDSALLWLLEKARPAAPAP